MKKVIFGAFMMLAGILGSAILLAGTMAHDWTLDGKLSFSWNLSTYGLMPSLVIFVLIAVAGLLLGIWGLVDKKD